jgi:predicted MPP superfamily phosphohydrolase
LTPTISSYIITSNIALSRLDAPGKSPGREIGPQHAGCLHGNQRNMLCRDFANRTFVVGVRLAADRLRCFYRSLVQLLECHMLENSGASWSFLHANDSHMGTPRSYRFRPAVNKRWAAIKQQMSATNAEFLLHGGDLTRDGESHEFELLQAKEDLDTLPFPTFAIPGNMDVGNKHTQQDGNNRKWSEMGLDWNDVDQNMTAKRLDLFASYFGPLHWTFLYRDVRFTGFFAGVAGSGLSHEARLWRLLERLPDLPEAKHHVAMMHYWPFMEQPDEPAWDITNPEQYDNWYFSIDPPHRGRLWESLTKAKVDILFCGHVHTGRPVQEVDGIRLYRAQSAGNTSQLSERWPDADRRFGFQLCEVNPDGIDVKFVPGTEQCEEFDSYGPMGHPTVDQRDYSIAREHPPLGPEV